ncbi:hypothetical protein R9C00_17125 [Flammeovirgaceae bacterium SG7u.111]|nr:hypothetical protein [Flammeovirgaceae bacterium SG7u.132]WPO33424.1 hypothetical protein R9C00_17125 [Flammeovirgaceae bacterium SG7u.111]
MTKEEFIKILKHSPEDAKYDAYRNIDSSYLDIETFKVLVSLLKNNDDKIRFFALFYLIEDFQKELSECGENVIQILIFLLKDVHAPIVDRTVWALSIIGKDALEYLIKAAKSSDLQLREKAIWAIKRNSNLNSNKTEIVKVLIRGLEDKNKEIKFSSMCALMDISPIRNNSIVDFDFKPIYRHIKPIAEEFSLSKVEHYQYWGSYYLGLIEKS